MTDLTTHIPWHIWLVVLPLLAAILSFLFNRFLLAVAIIASSGVFISLFELTTQYLHNGAFYYPIGGWGAPLGIEFFIDGLTIALAWMTAVVGTVIGLYAEGYFAIRQRKRKGYAIHDEQRGYFWPLWFLLWAGLNNLFLSADVFNQYVSLELIGLAAVALTALSGKTASRLSAMRYLLVNMAGSLCFLLGIALLYAQHGILDLAGLGVVVVQGSVANTSLALMLIGLLLKTAIFPMHFWLPPAHANALTPVSALLSALVVKAGFYVVLRLWFGPFAQVATENLVILLGGLGVCAVVWGSIQAMRQQRLKMLVAYSTIAQLGFLPIALVLVHNGGQGKGDLFLPVFFMLSHSCAKAAMFLASGAIWLAMGHDVVSRLGDVRRQLPVGTFALGIAGLCLVGLPPSGSFVAKWSFLHISLSGGHWWWGLVVASGSLLTAAYVYRVIRPWFVQEEAGLAHNKKGLAHLEWLAFSLALIALLLGFSAPYLDEMLVMGATGPYALLAGGVSP